MITGSGLISLLSGQIWRYRVGFGFATRVRAHGLLGHGAGRLGRAGRAHGRRRAEPGIRPKSLRKIENLFSFSKLFYKLQINLNSNQI
jgi:hypothetical protein